MNKEIWRDLMSVPFGEISYIVTLSCLHDKLGSVPRVRYVKLRVRMRRECQERFPRHRG